MIKAANINSQKETDAAGTLKAIFQTADLLLDKKRARTNFLLRHGIVFKRITPSNSRNEQRHYFYHYGEIEMHRQTNTLSLQPSDLFALDGSHERICTTLSVLAIASRSDQKKMAYLLGVSFNRQAKLCQQFICDEASKGILSDDHCQAYQNVLAEICKSSNFEYQMKQFTTEKQCSREYQAALYYLQGFSNYIMGGATEMILKYFELAQQLEPMYYFWWHVIWLYNRTMNFNTEDRHLLMVCAINAANYAPPEMELRMGTCWIISSIEYGKWKGESFRTPESWKMLNRLLSKAKNGKADPSIFHRKWICLKISELVIRYGNCWQEIRLAIKLLRRLYYTWPKCGLTLEALVLFLDAERDTGMPRNYFTFQRLFTKVTAIHGSNSKNFQKLFNFRSVNASSNNLRNSAAYLCDNDNATKSGYDMIYWKEFQKVSNEYIYQRVYSWRNMEISRFEIECLPVWMFNWINLIPESNTAFHTNPKAYLEERLRLPEFKTTSNYRKRHKLKKNDSNTTDGFGQWLCTKLCICALRLNFGSKKLQMLSATLLIVCRQALKENQKFLPKRHLEVYEYLLDSMEVCMSRKFKMTNNLSKGVNALRQRWDSTKQINNSAVISFAKGIIASLVGAEQNIALKYYRQAVKKEPGYYLWQHVLFENLNLVRLSRNDQIRPSDEEMLACRLAYELSPKNSKYSLDLAMLKIETLNTSVMMQEEIQNIFRLLRTTCRWKNSMCEMLAKLKMAELHSTRGFQRRITKTRHILMECYRKWPLNSMVLQKVANFFQYKAKKKEHWMAAEYYNKALQTFPGNYPCVMNYLCFLGNNKNKQYKEMITLIDKCLPEIEDLKDRANLLIIKGKAYWFQYKEQKVENSYKLELKDSACQTWVQVYNNYPDLPFDVKDSILVNSSIEFEYQVSWEEVVSSLMEFCIANGITVNESLTAAEEYA